MTRSTCCPHYSAAESCVLRARVYRNPVRFEPERVYVYDEVGHIGSFKLRLGIPRFDVGLVFPNGGVQLDIYVKGVQHISYIRNTAAEVRIAETDGRQLNFRRDFQTISQIVDTARRELCH